MFSFDGKIGLLVCEWKDFLEERKERLSFLGDSLNFGMPGFREVRF